MDRNKAFPGFLVGCIKSLSARRAWIEMGHEYNILHNRYGSLSARRAWIEIAVSSASGTLSDTSLSARRAWIEIFLPIG